VLPTSDVGGVDAAVYHVLWCLVLQTSVVRNRVSMFLHSSIGGQGNFTGVRLQGGGKCFTPETTTGDESCGLVNYQHAR